MNRDLIKFISLVLDKLETEYFKLDAIRNNIYSEIRELISLNRDILRKLYTMEFSNVHKDVTDLLSKVEKITEDIKTHDKRMILERIFKDILKEVIETVLLYMYISGDSSLISRIKVFDDSIIVNAYIEFLGEVRRILIDTIISGDVAKAEEHLNFMTESYNILVSKYFPNYFLSDYKKKLDQLRYNLERSKENYLYIKYRGV